MESTTLRGEKENTSPLEKFLLNFLLVIFFGALLGIGYVFFSYLFFPQQAKETLLTPLSSTTPTPTEEVTHVFQQALSNSCSESSSKYGSAISTIDINSLPISFNQQISLSGNPKAKAVCEGADGKRYVVLTASDNTVFYVYDKSLADPPSTQSSLFIPPPLAESISNENGISLFSFLQHQTNTTIGTMPVVVMGTKTLTLLGGENVFVTTTIQAIPGNDPRLIKLLNTFAISPTQLPNKNTIDTAKEFEYEAAIKNAFFANMQQLDVPQRANIAVLKSALDAFTAK